MRRSPAPVKRVAPTRYLRFAVGRPTSGLRRSPDDLLFGKPEVITTSPSLDEMEGGHLERRTWRCAFSGLLQISIITGVRFPFLQSAFQEIDFIYEFDDFWRPVGESDIRIASIAYR